MEGDPCLECGRTDLKLIDGFYYCVECGTQNTNVRETVVEQTAFGDGTFAITTKKKVKLQDNKIQMSTEWYKWHAYNFIISGLADELVAAGANPSFKTKLLWIWTRYIKKYQNKNELGLAKQPQDENNENKTFPSFIFEESNTTNAVEEVQEIETEEAVTKSSNKNVIMEGSKRNIRFLSRGLILAMLYLALNLDESEIQLSHIYRFIKEKSIDISNLQRFVPEEIPVKSIPQWTNFLHSKLCNMHQMRALTLSLLRKLDLGTPKVPDLRKIVDNYLTELCLPNDLKPLIYSLMHFHGCDFLDISNRMKESYIRLPDYEGIIMTYILVALKMCFGLDGDYEVNLSNVVDKINEDRDLSKSHRIGKYSESSNRLFSFREWCNYMQFRKVMLCKSCLRLAEQFNLDIDDYVYFEHMEERPKNKKELQDETAMDLLKKLPGEDEGRVIPKELFRPSLTPMYDYTDVIIEYSQDQETKFLLSEDFTQYSLKYACEFLELKDFNSENVIKGVSENRKTINKLILGTIVTKKTKSEMVFVKNCENRNWMKTNPPTIEHVTCENLQDLSNNEVTCEDLQTVTNFKETCEHLQNVINNKETCENSRNVSNGNKTCEDSQKNNNDIEDLQNVSINKETCVNLRVVNNSKEICYDLENVNNSNETCVDLQNVSKINETCTNLLNVANDVETCVDLQNVSKNNETCYDLQNVGNEKETYEDLQNVSNDRETYEQLQNVNNSKQVCYDLQNINNSEQTCVDLQNVSNDIKAGDDSQINNNDREICLDLQNNSKNNDSCNNLLNLGNEKETYEELQNVTNDKETSKDLQNVSSSKESDLRYESEKAANDEKIGTFRETNIISETIKEDRKQVLVPEEDNEKNIFDDDFVELDIKDDIEQNEMNISIENNENLPSQNNNFPNDDIESLSGTSDNGNYPTFDPETFDREQAIKELILHACKKYKISVPAEYRTKEPRKRKVNKFDDEAGGSIPTKRNRTSRGESKKKVEELMSNYYRYMHSDLLTKMEQEVNLAIRNTQLGDVLNVSQNHPANVTISDAPEQSSLCFENIDNQSNVNQNSTLEQNPNLETTNRTDVDYKTDEIDEHLESTLFDDEEEMNLDDLIPKGDPKFDEKKYDTNQLYIKIKIDDDEEDIFDLQNEPKLAEILDRKIEECRHSTEFANLTAEESRNRTEIAKLNVDNVVESVKTKYESDSEDEIALSELQEEKKSIEEMLAREENFDPLINKEEIPEFKYWFRHYDKDFMLRSLDWHQKFDDELKENTPASFYFVIKQCAAVLNCTTFYLYKQMQNFEQFIISRARNPD